MAFPSHRSSNDAQDDSGTSITVTLPATISSGDLLVVVMAIDGNPTVTWDNTSEGTWTELWNTTAGSAVTGLAYCKVADGTEDDQTLDIGLSTSQACCWRAVSYQDWEGTLSGVTAGTPAVDSNSNPNPPSVTAPGGAGDNLFVAVSCSDSNDDISGYPANYSTEQYHGDAGPSGSATIGMAEREYSSTDTDDPGTFTLASGEQWVAGTFVIEPAAAGGDVTLTPTVKNTVVADLNATNNNTRELSPTVKDVAVVDLNAVIQQNRDVEATVQDVAIAALAATSNNTRNLNPTVKDVSVVDYNATMLQNANLNPTVKNVIVADLNAEVEKSRTLNPTVKDVVVVDLNATVQLGGSLDIVVAAPVDVTVVDLDSALNLTRTLNATVVDVAVVALDGTTQLDSNLSPNTVNVLVEEWRAILQLGDGSGDEEQRLRRRLLSFMGHRR